MRSIKFSRGIYLLVLAVTFTLTQAATSFSQEPYKIGVAIGLTGPYAHTSLPNKRINEMQMEEINRSGGVNGHPLVLIFEDSESSDSKGLLAIKKLAVKDKVSAVITASGTGIVLVSLPFLEEQGLPLIANAGSSILAKPVKKWIFKIPALTTDAVEKNLDYMRKLGIKKVGILTVANPFGDEGRTELERLGPEYGIQIVATERFDSKDTDMSAQLTRIRSTDAQAIQVWSVGPQPAMIAKQRIQLGIKIPLFQSHGSADPEYLKLAGEAAEGNFLPTSALTVIADQLPDSRPQKAIAMKWNNRYKERYKEPVSSMSAYQVDCLEIVVNAMKKVGSDRAKLRDEIEGTKNYVGLSGVFNFSPTDHSGVSKKDLVMLTVERGEFKLIKE